MERLKLPAMHLVKLLAMTRILFLVSRIVRVRMMRIVSVLKPALVFALILLGSNSYNARWNCSGNKYRQDDEFDQLSHKSQFKLVENSGIIHPTLNPLLRYTDFYALHNIVDGLLLFNDPCASLIGNCAFGVARWTLCVVLPKFRDDIEHYFRNGACLVVRGFSMCMAC